MLAPYVETTRKDDCWRASAGVWLAAMDLERADPASALVEAHRNTVRLLQLLVRANSTLELHITSHPSLDAAQPGHVGMALRVQSHAACREAAIEQCLSHYLDVQPILSTLWPRAEFAAVTTLDKFRESYSPFRPGSCLRIERCSSLIRLSSPFDWKSRWIGFDNQPKLEPPGLTVSHTFPWVPVQDDWSGLLQTLLRHPMPQWLVMRVSNHSDPVANLGVLESNLRACEQYLASAPGDQVLLTAQLRSLRDVTFLELSRLNECALSVKVFLLAPGRACVTLASLLGQSISGDLARGLAPSVFQGGFSLGAVDPAVALDPSSSPEGTPFSADEVACAFRLPLITTDEPLGLSVRRNRTVATGFLPAVATEPCTVIGLNCHRGTERPVAVSLDHRMKHTFLIGMTGTGKSTMMLTMLLDDLRQGRGVCLIDPHGDLAEDLLARFPEERADDLILIDMADRERPVPMNLLAWSTIEQRDAIIDGLLSALLRIYRDPGMFGPIFERHFRNMLKLLMGDDPKRRPRFSLLDFSRLYQSEKLRDHLVQSMKDDQVRDFLHELHRVGYGDHKPENIAPYITAKLGRFIDDALLRRVFGHGEMAVDFGKILSGRRVLILKLGRGVFGANVADLITSQIIARFRAAAMARAAVAQAQRGSFFLYVDELGSLGRDETLSHLLSESRKYGLGLVLATQHASQLRDPEYSRNTLSAVLGNAGTVIAYRVGIEDAALLAPVFGPVITGQDLIESPNFEGYMRLHLSGVAARPFSFRNSPDTAPVSAERAERLRGQSRRRWGVSTAECDRRAGERREYIQKVEESG